MGDQGFRPGYNPSAPPGSFPPFPGGQYQPQYQPPGQPQYPYQPPGGAPYAPYGSQPPAGQPPYPSYPGQQPYAPFGSQPPFGGQPGYGQPYYWVQWSANSPPPPNAVQGGVDQDGTIIFVGKAFHEGDTVPAKVMPNKNVAYIAFAGAEVPKYNCEILCCDGGSYRFQWVPSQFGEYVQGAIEGGRTSSGEALFIGRTHYEGSQTVGKVHPSHQSMYISFDGREIPFKHYEVLVYRG